MLCWRMRLRQLLDKALLGPGPITRLGLLQAGHAHHDLSTLGIHYAY
jgi:hypothetical protein